MSIVLMGWTKVIHPDRQVDEYECGREGDAVIH